MKTTKYIVIGLAALFVIVIVAGFIKFNVVGDDIYLTQEDGSVVRAIDLEEYAFETESGEVGVFAYTDKEKDTATLKINGEFTQLNRSESASGAKYSSADGTIVFWEKGGEVLIEVNSEIAFTSSELIPIEEADETLRRRVEVLKSNKQGDPNANRYDSVGNGVDEDCDSDTGACSPGDPVPGIGITVEQGGSVTNEENPLYQDSEIEQENSIYIE